VCVTEEGVVAEIVGNRLGFLSVRT
jgi:hypothetical protein